MEIPKKISIGGTKYKVSVVKRINGIVYNFFNELAGSTLCGEIRKDDKHILIRKRENKDMKQTLYHEIAHGLCYELEGRYKEFIKLNNNENFIDFFAKKLMKTFNIKKVN